VTHLDIDASELLDALRERPDLDLVRRLVQFMFQELIETEATEQIGAERHERTATRTTRRNGSRSRTLNRTGNVGDSDVLIEGHDDEMSMGESPQAVLDFMLSDEMGRCLTSGKDPSAVDAGKTAALEALQPFATADGVVLHGHTWVVTATKL
jgi:hypothetical protein